MVQVLRLQIGDAVELIDDSGHAHRATIQTIDGERVSLSVGKPRHIHRESPIQITLAQALLKDRKMDTLIRQVTELGVNRWMPFPADRSVPRPDEERLKNRVARWKKIAREALKQCRRNQLPRIEPQVSFMAILEAAATSQLRLIFSENAREPFAETDTPSSNIDSVFLIVGPEGGFTPQEVDAAKAHGFSEVYLGPRILRAETTTLVACALTQHVFGDLGAYPEYIRPPRDSADTISCNVRDRRHMPAC